MKTVGDILSMADIDPKDVLIKYLREPQKRLYRQENSVPLNIHDQQTVAEHFEITYDGPVAGVLAAWLEKETDCVYLAYSLLAPRDRKYFQVARYLDENDQLSPVEITYEWIDRKNVDNVTKSKGVEIAIGRCVAMSNGRTYNFLNVAQRCPHSLRTELPKFILRTGKFFHGKDIVVYGMSGSVFRYTEIKPGNSVTDSYFLRNVENAIHIMEA